MSTLAGTTIRSPHEVAGEGCPAPCLDGVPGSEDGPLREATFYYPYGVAIGPNNTLLVADGDRIRRLTDSNMTLSTIQEVTSQDRVYTIAGQLIEGERDGVGPEASFNKPRVRGLAAACRSCDCCAALISVAVLCVARASSCQQKDVCM